MARDFWAFGSPDDDSPDPQIPAGYKLARGIPPDSPFGKFLGCRSCGCLVAAVKQATDRHTLFHDRLSNIHPSLGMVYD